MNIYDFIIECINEGLTAEEAEQQWNEAVAERHERFLDSYYNDPIVNEGWAQQDVIDMYRRER